MVNNMVLQGRLTKDPELRHTGSGVAVVSFTVAWSEKYGDKETGLFLPCVAWRGTAEHVSRYYKKGMEVVVEGNLITRSYEDKHGNTREVTELSVNRTHFCGGKKTEGGVTAASTVAAYQAPMGGAPKEEYAEITDADARLPF